MLPQRTQLFIFLNKPVRILRTYWVPDSSPCTGKMVSNPLKQCSVEERDNKHVTEDLKCSGENVFHPQVCDMPEWMLGYNLPWDGSSWCLDYEAQLITLQEKEAESHVHLRSKSIPY